MTDPIFRDRNLTKIYGQNVIFKDINLQVNEGDDRDHRSQWDRVKAHFFGCINLLTPHDGGQVFLDGRRSPPKRHDEDEVRQHIGMVFQNFLLFNHLTALDNVDQLTKVRKMTKEQAKAKALEQLQVGLADALDHYPGQLSGGQHNGCDCAGPGYGPAGHALRRAHLRPRPGAHR